MSSRIRIAFVIPSLTRGGAERQLLALLHGLDRSRFDPILVLFDREHNSTSYGEKGIDAHILSLKIPAGGNYRLRRGPMFLLGAARLATILHRFRIDILHTFLPVPAMIGGIAARVRKLSAFVVSRRSMTGLYRRNSQVLTWLDRTPLRVADAIVGNCDAIRNEAIEVDGIPAERAFTIYNGIDTDVFQDRPEPSLRQEIGFSPDDVIFGSIANLDKSKRHIDLVHAAKQLCSRYPTAKFLMAGSDHGELANLQSVIGSLELTSAFAVLPTTREPERLHRVIDVYVSSSETEGMSNSILEAMASARPVIATMVGGNPELVSPGVTGYLVPPCTPASIAACGATILEHQSIRTQMGRNARHRVKRHFSTLGMVNAFEALYAELVARPPVA